MDQQRSRWQEQLDEMHVLESMFPMDGEFEINDSIKEEIEKAIAIKNETVSTCLNCTITFLDFVKLDAAAPPQLSMTMPKEYPDGNALQVYLTCSNIPRQELQQMNQQLSVLSTTLQGQVACLEIYQLAHDLISTFIQKQEKPRVVDNIPTTLRTYCLGRRSIYFHHIIAKTKRKIVKELAQQLELGGFSKIGWPGIVIVEGNEVNVQEYVRQLQHLRWKQMVVRGEQTLEHIEDLDTARQLPKEFHEFGENQMSEIAAACKECGLEELFLATMKIYA